MLDTMKRATHGMLRGLTLAEKFKVYTKPNPPAENCGVPRIAVCDLVPNLGDTVMIFALLDALAEENPQATIICFTQGIARNLGLHPAVSKVYEFKRQRRWTFRLGSPGYLMDLRRWWKRELRGLRFDICVTLRGGMDPFHSAYLAYMLGGRIRAGYSPSLEPEYAVYDFHDELLFTHVVKQMKGIHEVDRGSEILQLAGLLHREVSLDRPVSSLLSIAASEKAERFRTSIPELAQPYAIIAPGSSDRRRAWPPERFLTLIRREVLSRGWMPVFTGGPELQGLCDAMAAQLNRSSVNLAGRTDFEQLIAVCAKAKVCLGNDSGIGHVAGACGVPTLMVTAFASQSRRSHHCSPWRSHSVGPWFAIAQPALQRPPCIEECLATEPHCILDVTEEDAISSLRDLLKRSNNGDV